MVDREDGACRLVHEDPFLCNAHAQFSAIGEDKLLIQHNRGCEFRPDGALIRHVGEEPSCTIFLLNAHTGVKTDLAAGRPHTPPLTGHEAWIGKTEDIIFTVRPKEAFAAGQGNTVVVRAGKPAGVWRPAGP